jgi:hypothetical protein
MVKHPEELGFKPGLKIRIGEPAEIIERSPDASTVKDVVYVALLSENVRPLEKGDALKIGQTKGTLRQRWERTLGIFRRDTLRDNEKEDRRKFLERANGKEISVWMKAAGKTEIPYSKGLTQNHFSTRCAEEDFLDEYYQPNLRWKPR